MTDCASSNYSMTGEPQWTLEASGIEGAAMMNHIPCLAHGIQLALSAFMSSLTVKGRAKSWESHEHDPQFWENESTVIGKSQRLRKEGNARMNKVSAMMPDVTKIIEKVCNRRHFERPETEPHIAENACCIDYPDTLSLKRLHWLSKSQSTNHRTMYYGSEDTVQFDTAVVWASLLNTRIHPRVAQKSKIQRLLATLHYTGWMDHRQVLHEWFKAIPIVDPVDVE